MNDTQVDISTCAGPGCPMLGTNSRSTTGESEWFCSIHFSTPAKDWHRTTHELNRLRWLVGIVRGLRALPIAKNWPALEAKARDLINESQCSEMNMKDSETPIAWTIRLEGILAKSCKDSAVQP